MPALRSLVVGSLLLSSAVAFAQAPCEAPRIRDVKPLMQAVKEDRAMVDAFQKAALACAKVGDACDQARLECGAVLTTTLNAQVNFDDGWWIRDMMLPYLAQQYPLPKSMGPGAPLTDISCNVDATQLSGAAQRRFAQAERRAGVLNEYPKYAKWANDAWSLCKERAAADAQRTSAAQAEAAKLAAAAAAAREAEEARQRAAADAKRKAEDEARKAKEAQQEAARKAREEADERARKAKEEADERARAQREAYEKQVREAKDAEARQKAERERAVWEAQEKARILEEERKVKEREGRVEAARLQKEQLLAQAESEAELSEDEAAKRRRLAIEKLEAEEAAAADSREKKLELARKKAAGIKVDDSHERSRGSLLASFFGGFGSVTETGAEGQGVLLGAQAALHFGIWGTAPSEGMASGFELRILGRFAQAVSLGSLRSLEGAVSGRYYFGPVGVGAAGEYRSFDSTVNNAPRSFSTFAFGPAVGIAMVDTPSWRAIFSAQWLPLGTGAMDPYRATGDIEIGYEWFVFDLAGGSLSDPVAPRRVGFFLGANIGVRLNW